MKKLSLWPCARVTGLSINLIRELQVIHNPIAHPHRTLQHVSAFRFVLTDFLSARESILKEYFWFCRAVKNFVGKVLLLHYHPGLLNCLGWVCFLSPESKLNMEKQISVSVNHISETNPWKTWGLIQLSVLLIQGLKLFFSTAFP